MTPWVNRSRPWAVYAENAGCGTQYARRNDGIPPMNTMEAEKPNTAALIGKIAAGLVVALGAAGLVAFVLLSDEEEVDDSPAARVSSTNVVDPRKKAAVDEPPEPEPVAVPEPEPYDEPEPEPKARTKSRRGDGGDAGLLRTRVETTPEPEPKAPTGRGAREIKVGFARAAKTAKQCGERHGAVAGQRITVQATINQAGTVISANSTGSNRSTPLGKCVAGAVKSKARFIKWTQPLEHASYVIKL